MSQLILIRGLPGSGKSTMARVLALVGYEHYEADQFFMLDGAYRFDGAKLPEAHAWCLSMANACLSRGGDCVVANTFSRKWEMQPYIDAAKSVGARVRIIEAKGEYQNVHGVPAASIDAMRRRWEAA